MEMRHLRVRLRLRYRCDLYRGGAIHVGLPQVLEHLCGARFALSCDTRLQVACAGGT
jgi:hypothetical protein